MLTVYGRADSSAVARVMWTIGELGLAYQRIDRGGEFGGLDAPDYRAMNPAGRIPAVRLADGRALWESNAIIRYLAGVHAPGVLIPDDPVARAQAEAWMDWSGAFGDAIGAIRTAYRRPGATPADCAPAVAAAAAKLAVLDRALEGRAYLMGDALTVADLALGPWAQRWFRIPEAIAMPATPHLARWREALSRRPAFITHIAAVVSSRPQPIG